LLQIWFYFDAEAWIGGCAVDFDETSVCTGFIGGISLPGG
jgi:hypothetical protein